MNKRNDAKALEPEALALLQECFDKLLDRRDLSRDSEGAYAIATALFKAHHRGITDKREVMRLADIVPEPLSA